MKFHLLCGVVVFSLCLTSLVSKSWARGGDAVTTLPRTTSVSYRASLTYLARELRNRSLDSKTSDLLTGLYAIAQDGRIPPKRLWLTSPFRNDMDAKRYRASRKYSVTSRHEAAEAYIELACSVLSLDPQDLAHI
jgi:hypothetical protein